MLVIFYGPHYFSQEPDRKSACDLQKYVAGARGETAKG
jgi:hypothetical protein